MSELATTLISVLGTFLTALLGLFITVLTTKHKQKVEHDKELKKEKRKTKALAELTNYVMGGVDTILDKNVKMKPELRNTLKKASEKYHKLDIIPEVAEKSDKKE